MKPATLMDAGLIALVAFTWAMSNPMGLPRWVLGLWPAYRCFCGVRRDA